MVGLDFFTLIFIYLFTYFFFITSFPYYSLLISRKGSSLSIKKEQIPLAKNRLSLGCRETRFILLSDRLIISFLIFVVNTGPQIQ